MEIQLTQFIKVSIQCKQIDTHKKIWHNKNHVKCFVLFTANVLSSWSLQQVCASRFTENRSKSKWRIFTSVHWVHYSWFLDSCCCPQHRRPRDCPANLLSRWCDQRDCSTSFHSDLYLVNPATGFTVAYLWAALKVNKTFVHFEFMHCQELSPSALCSSDSESSSSSLIDKSDVSLLLVSADSCKLALSCVSSFLPPFSSCLRKVPVRNANKQMMIKIYIATVWLWKRVAWALLLPERVFTLR